MRGCLETEEFKGKRGKPNIMDHYHKWGGGGGEGSARSIQLPRYLVYIYLLAIHISGMTCCHGQLYCVKL